MRPSKVRSLQCAAGANCDGSNTPSRQCSSDAWIGGRSAGDTTWEGERECVASELLPFRRRRRQILVAGMGGRAGCARCQVSRPSKHTHSLVLMAHIEALMQCGPSPRTCAARHGSVSLGAVGLVAETTCLCPSDRAWLILAGHLPHQPAWGRGPCRMGTLVQIACSRSTRERIRAALL
jgi:hypothetical protein